MGKRIRKVMVGVAALLALALGGSAFAQAQSSPSSAPERATAPDRDNIQSGDQTTPDARAVSHTTRHVVRHRTAVGASATDGDSVQSGDQATPDRPGSGASEQSGAESPEQSGESVANSDGPGGHADEPGNPTADHQFQGNE
jgi:hypothetical protein